MPLGMTGSLNTPEMIVPNPNGIIVCQDAQFRDPLRMELEAGMAFQGISELTLGKTTPPSIFEHGLPSVPGLDELAIRTIEKYLTGIGDKLAYKTEMIGMEMCNEKIGLPPDQP